MNESKQNSPFRYTYRAKEQEEIKRIRSKYLPDEENKLEKLRRLDRQTTQKATLFALLAGILGSLILGVGMCCCMVWAESVFALGIVVGILGIASLSVAYPLYNRVLKKERERIAPEILHLTEELLR